MAKINALISTKPYYKHVIKPFFTIDTQHPDAVDFEQVFQEMKYM
jgi:hypothetical protein